MHLYLKLLIFLSIVWVEVEGQSNRRPYQTPPNIIQTSQVFVTARARYANFAIPCEVEQGTAPPDIEWRFNGGLIDRNGTNAQPFRQMINGRLFFRTTGRLEVGYYQCKANNSLGEDKVEHTLVIFEDMDSDQGNAEQTTPTPPFTVVATTETSITLRRTNLSDSNPLEIYYYPDVGEDLKKRVRMSPSMTEYILEDLHCSTVYKISALYETGYVFYVRTKGLSLPPPMADTFISVGENNITMNLTTWNEGDCPEWTFTIKYIPTILKGFGDWITNENIASTENYTITGLVSGTNYTFEIYSSGFSSRGGVQVYKIRTLSSNSTEDAGSSVRPEIHLQDKYVKFNITKGSHDFHYSATCWVPTNSTKIDWLNPRNEKIGEILNTSSSIYQEKTKGVQVSATKLYIDKVTAKDSGTFTCLSSPSGLRNSFSFKVQVEDNKKDSGSYSEESAYEGTEYCMKCPSSQDSDSEYQDHLNVTWKVNNFTPMSPKYITNDNFELCIQNVTKEDSKPTYSCRNNSPKLEKQIKINVLVQPWLTNTLETKNFNVFGTTLNLTCTAKDANPIAKFKWLIENQLLDPSEASTEYIIINNEENISVLQVLYTNKSSPGPYTCHAKNSVGVAELQFSLHQAQKPPRPMLQLNMTAFDGVRVYTKDNLPKDASPIVEYVVQVKLIDDTKEEQAWKLAQVAKTENGFLVHKLMSETKYLVRAASKNSANLVGEYSLPIAVNTDFINNYSLPIEFKGLFAFTSETDSQVYANLGEWVNLTCAVFADPQAVLHWRRGNTTVEKNHAVRKMYPRVNMSVLRIFLKHNTSFGDYICAATRQNVEELIEWTISVHSQTPFFANNEPITLVPQAHTLFLAQNSSYFVSCQTPNGDTTDLEWLDKNNKRIRNYNTASSIHIVNQEGVGVDLIFTSVQKTDEGSYTCLYNTTTKAVFHLSVIQDNLD